MPAILENPRSEHHGVVATVLHGTALKQGPTRLTGAARALRPLLWTAGLLLIAWALADPGFRDAEGSIQGAVGVPVAVGLAGIILGVAVFGSLTLSAFWLAVALVGQAVALQLIEAGPSIRYQHYKPLGRLLSETHPLLLGYLAMQATLVTIVLMARWRELRAWTSRAFKPWQLAGAALVFVLTSATVSAQVSVYAAEVLFATFVQAINLGTILLMVLALPRSVLEWLQRRLDAWLGRPGEGETEARGPDRFALYVAAWVALLAGLLAVFVYEGHPHIPDEVAYVLQARFLAEGVLALPAPPVPDAFYVYLMAVEGDQWYATFPPGWPAVLALGVRFGVPWLINPILAGANVVLAYLLLRELYDRRTARLAVALLAVSPWHVFMAMNLMAHTFTLTSTLLAALAMAWVRRNGSLLWAGISGGAVGMVSLIRPLEGFVLAGLLGLWAMGVGGARLRPWAIFAFVLGCVAVGAIALPYNALLTGDPTAFPVMVYMEKVFGPGSNALGFGPERGANWPIDPFPGHGPLDVLVNTNLNAFSVNIELFGWSVGCLALVALFVLSGSMKRSDYLMLATATATVVASAFYWFSGGPDFGARYWYMLLVPLVALAVRAIHYLERRVQVLTGGSVSAAAVPAAVLALSALALVNYFPWRAADKYHHYLNMRPDIRHLASEYGFGKSLVLVQGNGQDYASTAVYNPLNFQADAPIYAWDRNPQLTARVLEAYPDRPVWRLQGPTITGGPFRVIGGPLPAGQLIAENEAG